MTLSIWPADRCEPGEAHIAQINGFIMKCSMGKAAPREDWRLKKLTGFCLAMPEATRELMGRHAGFYIRKKTFAYFR